MERVPGSGASRSRRGPFRAGGGGQALRGPQRRAGPARPHPPRHAGCSAWGMRLMAKAMAGTAGSRARWRGCHVGRARLRQRESLPGSHWSPGRRRRRRLWCQQRHPAPFPHASPGGAGPGGLRGPRRQEWGGEKGLPFISLPGCNCQSRMENTNTVSGRPVGRGPSLHPPATARHYRGAAVSAQMAGAPAETPQFTRAPAGLTEEDPPSSRDAGKEVLQGGACPLGVPKCRSQ